LPEAIKTDGVASRQGLFRLIPASAECWGFVRRYKGSGT
jgi:hypothetical protein